MANDTPAPSVDTTQPLLNVRGWLVRFDQDHWKPLGDPVDNPVPYDQSIDARAIQTISPCYKAGWLYAGHDPSYDDYVILSTSNYSFATAGNHAAWNAFVNYLRGER